MARENFIENARTLSQGDALAGLGMRSQGAGLAPALSFDPAHLQEQRGLRRSCLSHVGQKGKR